MSDKNATILKKTICLTEEQIDELRPLLDEAEKGCASNKKIIVIGHYKGGQWFTIHALTHEASHAIQKGLYEFLEEDQPDKLFSDATSEAEA